MEIADLTQKLVRSRLLQNEEQKLPIPPSLLEHYDRR